MGRVKQDLEKSAGKPQMNNQLEAIHAIGQTHYEIPGSSG